MARKRYRVTGELPVAGHEPGDKFTHDFGDQADVLIGSGHIQAVDTKKAVDKEAVTPVKKEDSPA